MEGLLKMIGDAIRANPALLPPELRPVSVTASAQESQGTST